MSTTSRSSSTAKHYRSVEQRRARLRPCSRFLALGSRLSLLPHCRLPIGNSPFSIAYCLLPIALFFLPACASRTGSPYAPLPPEIKGEQATFTLPLVSSTVR